MTKVYMTANGRKIAKNGEENKAIEYFGSEKKFKESIGNNVFRVIIDEDGDQIGEW